MRRLHVALDRDEAGELRRRHDLQRELGLEAEWLTPTRCRELEPGLTPTFVGGVHVPGEGVVDPRALIAALLAGARSAGAEVSHRHRGNRRPLGRRAASSASATAVRRRASGRRESCSPPAPGRPATGSPKARPPVRPVKGEILQLRARDGALAPATRILASERVYLVPRADGELVVGATVEEQGFDTTVTAGGVHELLRDAYRSCPDVAELELVEARAGLRPGTPDNAARRRAARSTGCWSPPATTATASCSPR